MAGLAMFNPNTANAPVKDSYGVVLTIANATDPDDKYLWRYQLGFCKGAFLRWKINASGIWSAWSQL